jgi:hypothetical protein
MDCRKDEGTQHESPQSAGGEAVNDPMKQAWTDVEERLSALARSMKDRYRGAGEGDRDDEAVVGDEDSAALRNAFDRVVSAVRDLGDRAADVARDDEVKAQARQAAASLNDALSTTVNVIGEQVGGLFKRTGRRTPAADDAATASPDISS